MFAVLSRLFRACVLVYERNCLSIAKGAAYSGLLALFPVLTTLATVLVQAQAGPVIRPISQFLARLLPPGSEKQVLDLLVAGGRKPAAVLIVASALALFAASGFMMSLLEGFDAVYKVGTRRSWLRQRAVAAALVFTTAGPAIGASSLILFGQQIGSAVARWLHGNVAPLASGMSLLGELARIALALATMTLVAALTYKIGPNRAVAWRSAWPGAIIATPLWLAATAAFGWYVRNMAGYNVMYGSVGTVIALLGWMYLLAVIACVGCAYNAIGRRGKGAR